MKKSKYIVKVLLFSSILLLHLIFLYFIKYSNQHLSLHEFSFANIGNLFNLLVTISAIVCVVFYLMKKKSSRYLFISLAILTIFLVISYISSLINFPPLRIYIFGQPGNKILDAAFFTIYQFILFTFISALWISIMGFERLILIRSLLNGILLLFFFLVLTYVFIQDKGTGSENWNISKSDKNVIVVLGAAVWSGNQPSPSLAGRVDRAIELFNEGYAGEMLLTGGNAPGEMSEAEVAMKYARKSGMQMSKVKIESITSSTAEQINFIKRNLINKEDINEIIVISDSYHLVRVLEISKFFNIDIKVAASKIKLGEEGKVYRKLRESIALIVFWSFAL